MTSLRSALQAAMAPRQIFHAPVWGDPRAMSEALRDILKSLGHADGGPPPDEDALLASLRRFALTRQPASFKELKQVCYGATVPVGQSRWRVIDRPPLFDSLLGLVDAQRSMLRQYRRCYQGLLNGYFGFDKRDEASAAGSANWTRLRDFLHRRLTPIVDASERRGVAPEWLAALAAHRNLLTDEPCNRYAQDLLRGRSADLKSVCASLGIAGTSWVWDEALMAYVQAVCDADDDGFRRHLAGVLDLIDGKTEMRLPEPLAIGATARMVSRYSRCVDRPEHIGLRDASVRLIGNPWVKRTAWDAHVGDEPARQMVESWLKRGLMKDFFELLAHDGDNDRRRLNYWLEWEPHIADMWFVLGSQATNSRDTKFVDLRKRMEGRCRVLSGSTPHNNAFAMRIGPLLVIEFGARGNACYAFAAADFKGDLDSKTLSVHVLKQRAGAIRLKHIDDKGRRWERKFDDELQKLLHSVPNRQGMLPKPQVAAAPARRPLDFVRIRTRCIELGFEWEDNRSRGGALWVLMPRRQDHFGFAELLEFNGFRFTEGKGFWFKDGAG